MKQALTEALVEFDNHIFDFGKLESLAAAARLVERLLPGECENCHGDGHEHDHDWTVLDMACLVCHGSGQVWDEEIEEAVGGALVECDYGAVMSEPMTLRLVHAVLSAIAELLTEKAGSQ